MYDPKLLKVIHEERIAPFIKWRHPETVRHELDKPGFGQQIARLSEKFAQLKTKWNRPEHRSFQGKRASRPL